jgi:purine-nucleoside phosphorylase
MPTSRKAQTDPEVTAARLRRLCPLRPTLAIVLGSGFRGALEALGKVKAVSYARLPGFPRPTVPGHDGVLGFGVSGGTPVLVLGGRAHFYEGHSMEQVTFAVRVLAAFGIRDLLLTNAAGAINPRFRPGEFMVLSDHINLMGTNPLRGPGRAGLLPFVDLTDTYDVDLRRLLEKAAGRRGIRLRSGVYLAVCGPSYETPAEVRAFARLGADAVGMSTVPEAVVARQCGLRVAALSCLTNAAAGVGAEKLSHDEVLETGEKAKDLAAQLLKGFVSLYGQKFSGKKNAIEKCR